MSTDGRAQRGRLVTIEGIEGVGKSTNVAFIADHLRQRGRSVRITREPGGVPVAERIRELLLATDSNGPPPMCELLLLFAARSAHLEQLVCPALDAGHWVVCDRFTDASYAYQSGGRGLPESAVRTLERLVQDDLQPDLTILLNAAVQETAIRRRERGANDRFERLNSAFFERVRSAYLELARREPARIRVIDASRPLHEVQGQIAEVLDSFIANQ